MVKKVGIWGTCLLFYSSVKLFAGFKSGNVAFEFVLSAVQRSKKHSIVLYRSVIADFPVSPVKSTQIPGPTTGSSPIDSSLQIY